MSGFFEETDVVKEQQVEKTLIEYSSFEDNNYNVFEQELSENLHVNMTIEEQVAQVVLTAVQIEFGPEVISNTKMLTLLKDTMLIDQEKREEVAALAEKLLKTGKNRAVWPVS